MEKGNQVGDFKTFVPIVIPKYNKASESCLGAFKNIKKAIGDRIGTNDFRVRYTYIEGDNCENMEIENDWEATTLFDYIRRTKVDTMRLIINKK